MSPQDVDARSRPEGPFESADIRHSRVVSGDELVRFLDFVDAFGSEADQVLSLRRGYDETRMLTTLLRNHLTGKLTTTSLLADSSGLGYGTAIRAIRAIEARGLLIRRPRTRTGKSFSLHPSVKLIDEWQEYARRIRGAIGGTLDIGASGKSEIGDYYFGASYARSNTIPPPTPFGSKLKLRRGLRVLAHADPTFMAINALKRQFESLFGIRINSRALSIDRLRQEILENAERKISRYDLVACDLPWFGELVEKGALMPIDGLIAGSGTELGDFHKAALASARYRGVQFGLPVQTTPELFCVRRDLCNEAGIGIPYTIADVLEAARVLHDPSAGRAGIAWNAARGTPLGHSFMFVMGAMGRPVLNLRQRDDDFDAEWVEGEHYRPMLDSEEALQTAEYLRELVNYSPVSVLSMSWYERAKAYAGGHAAMAYNATLLAPLFELNPESPACGTTEILPHPYGPGGKPIAPVGGYALAIPSNLEADRIDPIWTALNAFISPESIKLYIENGSLVSPRYSVSMDPEIRRISPVMTIVDGMARTGMLQYWPRPPVPEITELISIIGCEMHDMLQGALSVSQALANAQRRADRLMRSRGRY